MTPEAAAPVGAGRLPSDATLVRRLTDARRARGAPTPVELVDRRRGGHSSTFPNEVVTVSLGGELDRIFCKYDVGNRHPVFGHRRDLRYEAAVYAHVLDHLPTRTVAFLGVHDEPDSGETSLFLEYVEGIPYAWSGSAASLDAALAWLGRFHAGGAEPALAPDASFLIRYDRDYYAGWAERTREFARPLRHARPWVDAVCREFVEVAGILVDEDPVIVHGEYYAKNVLVSDGAVYPIDWESAALGAGEIDVAAALDGWWEPDLAARAEQTYARARWPNGAPREFGRRLAVARLYTQLRWLGDRREWTLSPDVDWRFDAAENAARRLGVL